MSRRFIKSTFKKMTNRHNRRWLFATKQADPYEHERNNRVYCQSMRDAADRRNDEFMDDYNWYMESKDKKSEEELMAEAQVHEQSLFSMVKNVLGLGKNTRH